MKQLFVIVTGLMAVLSVQQAHAQHGDDVPMSPGTITGEMLERCSELGISRVQCSDASILQADRVELAENSKE